MAQPVNSSGISQGVEQFEKQIQSALQSLGNPRVHYKWEECNELLSTIATSITALSASQGEKRWEGLAKAVEASDRHLLKWNFNLAKYDYLINLPKRVEWMKAEFDAVVNPLAATENLKELRRLFTETSQGVPRINHEQELQAAKLIRIGMFRSSVRELRHRISKLGQGLPQGSDNELPQMIASELYDLYGFNILEAQRNLREAQKVTQKGQGLENLLNDLSSFAGQFSQSILFTKKPNWTEIRMSYSDFIGAALEKVDFIEKQSRIHFSRELGYSATPEQHLRVSIYEDTGTPDRSVVTGLREMMKDWLINEADPRPQRGFGRAYTEQEIEDFCGKYAGRLFRVDLDRQTVGFYLIFVDEQRFPKDVQHALDQMEKAGEYMGVLTGWTEVIGITQAGRNLAKSQGIDLYTMMQEAAKDTFASFQKEKVFAEVREGTYANLAKADHVKPKRGWTETGVEIQTGRFPYQIIKMVLSPGGNWG